MVPSLRIGWLLFALGSDGCLAQDSAYYRGELNGENNRRFFAEIADRAPARLYIDSPGGEVEAGIELGRWVHAQGVHVLVRGECLSACANYVFTAGPRRTLLPDSVVGWHGNYHHLLLTGLWREEIAGRVRRTGEDPLAAERAVGLQVERLVGLERAFFEALGVDQRICWVGKVPPFSVPDYYTLSAADMARFGVRGTTTPPDYNALDWPRRGLAVAFIELQEELPSLPADRGPATDSASARRRGHAGRCTMPRTVAMGLPKPSCRSGSMPTPAPGP